MWGVSITVYYILLPGSTKKCRVRKLQLFPQQLYPVSGHYVQACSLSPDFYVQSVVVDSEDCVVQVSCVSHLSLLCPLFLYSLRETMSPNLNNVKLDHQIARSHQPALTFHSYPEATEAITKSTFTIQTYSTAQRNTS